MFCQLGIRLLTLFVGDILACRCKYEGKAMVRPWSTQIGCNVIWDLQLGASFNTETVSAPWLVYDVLIIPLWHEKSKIELSVSVIERERERQKKRVMRRCPGHFNCDESRLTRGDKLPACGMDGRLGSVRMVLPNKTHVPESRPNLGLLLQHASFKFH